MTRYQVVCVELDAQKDPEERVQYIGIRRDTDNSEWEEISQDEAIRLIDENNDVLYIDSKDLGYTENSSIELTIESGLTSERRYIDIPSRDKHFESSLLELFSRIGSCSSLKMLRRARS